MPSSLRSKIHSGPVKRSRVSVAAIGSSHSGRGVGIDPNSTRFARSAAAGGISSARADGRILAEGRSFRSPSLLAPRALYGLMGPSQREGEIAHGERHAASAEYTERLLALVCRNLFREHSALL